MSAAERHESPQARETPGPGSSRAGSKSVDCRWVPKTYLRKDLARSTLQEPLSMTHDSEHPDNSKYEYELP